MKKSPFIIYLMAALLGIQPALADNTTNLSGGVANTDTHTYVGSYIGESEAYYEVGITSGAAYPGDYTVYGARAEQQGVEITKAVVTMDGGSVANIYGGYSKFTGADRNQVKMIEGQGNVSGNVSGNVYGGYCLAGDADENVVEIVGNIAGSVYGGYSASTGSTDSNKVTLGNGGYAVIVCGGDSGIPHPDVDIDKEGGGDLVPDVENIVELGANSVSAPFSISNSVTIGTGAHANEVYGGASANMYSSGNTIEISGFVDKLVVGGLSKGNTSSSYSSMNTITIKDGAHVAVGPNKSDDACVCGGASAASYVANNSVAISGDNTQVGCDVYGGYGDKAGKQIKQNSITVEDGTITASLYGGFGAGTALTNSVTISGGSVTKDVFGASSLQGYAKENAVAISGGSVAGSVVAGESVLGQANNNGVFISNGELANVYGARGVSARQNLVVISGGTVTGIMAGADAATAVDNGVHLVGEGATITVGENSTEIMGNAMQLGDIYGAINTDPNASSGNSVDVYGSGITANSLQGMQTLNFHMVEAIENKNTPMVTLTSEDSKSALALGPELLLNFDAMDAMTWQPGDSVTLVSSALDIKVDSSLLEKEYNIYRYGDPEQIPVGTAKLELHQEGHILKLVVPGSVPEPTTGTLGLLALAALAARRRK